MLDALPLCHVTPPLLLFLMPPQYMLRHTLFRCVTPTIFHAADAVYAAMPMRAAPIFLPADFTSYGYVNTLYFDAFACFAIRVISTMPLILPCCCHDFRYAADRSPRCHVKETDAAAATLRRMPPLSLIRRFDYFFDCCRYAPLIF